MDLSSLPSRTPSLELTGVASAIAGALVQSVRETSAKHTGDLREAIWGCKGPLGRAICLSGTLLVILLCPTVALLVFHLFEDCCGSVTLFAERVSSGGLPYVLDFLPWPSLQALQYILAFGAVQALLQLVLPGKTFHGPVTPMGNTPVYKANGVLSYLVTVALFFTAWRLALFDPAAVYDSLGSILATSNLVSFAVCVLLLLKGWHAPTTSDHRTTGSIIYDFYSGVELFPRIGRSFDIKTWTNCRMGMMSWGVLPLCYAAKQAQLYGQVSPSMLVSVLLMEAYVFKFFLWETGYWSSMDITHDRAGFYLCWGCLVWVPGVYTSPAMYLVRHPNQLRPAVAAGLLLAGLVSIAVNYDVDRQRLQFRRTHGKAYIWGRPPRTVKASYTTGSGKTESSLLLASGWWGLSRHFHFLPELLAAFLWTVPALFEDFAPYFYFFFLAALLADRAMRHDMRCKAKYGRHWDRYCSLVPYKIIPYVY